MFFLGMTRERDSARTLTVDLCTSTYSNCPDRLAVGVTFDRRTLWNISKAYYVGKALNASESEKFGVGVTLDTLKSHGREVDRYFDSVLVNTASREMAMKMTTGQEKVAADLPPIIWRFGSV